MSAAQFTPSYPSSSTDGPAFVSLTDFENFQTFYYNTTAPTPSHQLLWACPGQCSTSFKLTLMADVNNKGVEADVALANTSAHWYDWTPRNYSAFSWDDAFYFLIVDSGGYYNYSTSFYLHSYPYTDGTTDNRNTMATSGGVHSSGVGVGGFIGIILGLLAAVTVSIIAIWIYCGRRRHRSRVAQGQADQDQATGPHGGAPSSETGEMLGNSEQRTQTGNTTKIAPDQQNPTPAAVQMPVEYYSPDTSRP